MHVRLILWLILCVFGNLSLVAGEAASGATHQEAAVILHGNQVTVLRATVYGYTPNERATLAHRRLLDLLAGDGAGMVGTRVITDGTLLTLDGQDALLLVPEDADRLLGETLAEAVGKAQQALVRAVAEDRGPVNRERLTSVAVRILSATAIFAVIILALVMLRRLLLRGLGHLTTTTGGVGSNREIETFIRDQLTRVLRWVVLLTTWAASLLVGYLWLTACLTAFPLTRDLGDQLGGRLLEFSFDLLRNAGAAIPGLTVVAAIFCVTGLLARVVRLFFARIEHRRITLGWLNPDTAVPTRRISTVVMWFFAVAMAYPYVPGSSSDAFKGLSVFVGVIVSLGGASLVGQAASGFILTYLGIIRRGDYVQIGAIEGEVATIGIFNTRIETVFKEAVSVPNVFLLTNTSTNLSRFPGRDGVIVQATVTIGYDAPWRQVHQMLLAAAAGTPGLQTTPEPFVQQRALADFFVEYHLCAHLLKPIERIPVLSRLYAEIQDRFNEAGIQIMSPHYMQEPSKPMTVPPERWQPPAVTNPGS